MEQKVQPKPANVPEQGAVNPEPFSLGFLIDEFQVNPEGNELWADNAFDVGGDWSPDLTDFFDKGPYLGSFGDQ
jgi:hypothetical protein